MTKFRTTGSDVTPPPPVKRKPVYRTGIDPPPGRVGIYKDGQRRGHVGPHAGVGVVSKLLGGTMAEIGKVRGKPAWIATGPSRTNAVARAANAKLAKSIKTDRGSVSSRGKR
jgi:hypothetical protein